MAFANPDIQLDLEGREPLTLRFSVRAMAALQDHWKLTNLDEVMRKVATMDGEGMTMDDYAAVMWAALRTHHPEITMSDALEVLDFIGLPALTMVLTQSAGASFPQGGGGQAPANPPRQKRGR